MSGAVHTVSVVVPCFNRASLIGETLESALAQTRPADEIIVVDDGSTDDSVAVASRFPAEIVRLERNGGLSAALNAGIARARCDLVALLDSDDLWEPNHLALVAGLLEAHPEAAVAAGTAEMFGDTTGRFQPHFPEGQPVDVFDTAFETWVLLPTVSVLRRSAVLGAGGYYEALPYGNDFDLMMRLAARHPFVCTHTVTGRWRRHGAQMSTAYFEQIRSMHKLRRRFIDEHGAWAAARGADLPARARDIWRAELLRAWQSRDLGLYETLLGCAESVPGVSRRERMAWAARATVAPLVQGTWDRLPTPWRRRIRGLPPVA